MRKIRGTTYCIMTDLSRKSDGSQIPSP
jgi:hypothetical protein